MKGLLLGILLLLMAGGSCAYVSITYGTFQTCVAVEATLRESVMAALQADVQRKTGSSVVGNVSRSVLQPLAEPLITTEVHKDTKDRTWFQCALDLIYIDFLGGRAARVEAIRQRLPVS
jgi:hypothetical protein